MNLSERVSKYLNYLTRDVKWTSNEDQTEPNLILEFRDHE